MKKSQTISKCKVCGKTRLMTSDHVCYACKQKKTRIKNKEKGIRSYEPYDRLKTPEINW